MEKFVRSGDKGEEPRIFSWEQSKKKDSHIGDQFKTLRNRSERKKKKEKKTREREGEKVLRILYQCSPGSDSFLTLCAGTGDQQCHIQTLQPAAFQEKV